MNLLTGDYALSTSDADEFGLSVSRANGWIYVPAASGLSPGYNDRANRLVGYYRDSTGYHELSSAKAGWVDAWQELSVDMDLPAGTTEAFVRLYNGVHIWMDVMPRPG